MPGAIIRHRVPLLVLVAACAPPSPVAPVPAPHPFVENWILLPEPSVTSGIALGAAFDLEGGLNLGCYTFSQAAADSVGGSTWDRMEFRWERTSSDSLFLRIAKLLNADAALVGAEGAYLRLDSVRVIRAADPTPSAACAATAIDGTPIRPAVTALIGAKSYTLHSWSRNHRNLAARAAGAGALATSGGQFVRGEADSAVVSFNSFRWLGAQYTGFEATPVNGISPVSFNLEEIAVIPPRYEVRVVWVQGPLYEVASRMTQPPGPWVKVRVEPNQAFGLGQQPGSRGYWTDARIHVDSLGRVTLIPERRGYRTRNWVGERSRHDLMDWIRARRP